MSAFSFLEQADRRHRNREELAGEHPFGDLVQILLSLLFLGVWAADSFVFRVSTFISGSVPLWVRLAVSAALLLVSVYLSVRSIAQIFFGPQDPPRVVKEGLYGVVRHPMYLGALFFFLSLALATLSLLALAVWVAMSFFYDFLSAYEEKLLLSKFGREYAEYMTEVPRWIPRLRRRTPRSSRAAG